MAKLTGRKTDKRNFAKSRLHHIFGLAESDERKTATIMSVVILAVVWYVYSSISNFWVTANLTMAVSGTVLIGLSFLLGPIFRWFLPGNDPSEYRKIFGMLVFGLIAIHVLISFSFRSASTFKECNELSVIAASLSFIIFALLASTSSSLVIEGIGYEKWVTIQRTGYIALVLAMIHFYLVGKERFIGSLLGQIVYIIVSLAILTKIVQIVKKE